VHILTIVLSSVTFAVRSSVARCPASSTATNVAPWVGPAGQMGVTAGGVW